MNRFDLIKAYVEHALGRPLETCRPVPLTGWQAVEALWPLNERFRPNIHQIRSLPYDAAFEPEADGAIEALVLRGDGWAAFQRAHGAFCWSATSRACWSRWPTSMRATRLCRFRLSCRPLCT